VLDYGLLVGLRVEDQNKSLTGLDFLVSRPRIRFNYRGSASVEDVAWIRGKSASVQGFRIRAECKAAAHSGGHFVVEVERPVPAVDPSGYAVLGAIDIKRRFFDPWIAQGNDRL
jgi:hypothetical protein